MDRRHFLVSAGALGLLPTVAKAQDAATERYIGSIVVLSGMMGWFYETEGELLTNATDSNLADETWRVDVLAPFAIARAAQDVILTLTPPTAFEESHDYFRQAIDAAAESGWAMTDVVLEGDVAAMTTASEHMDRSRQFIDQAVAALPQT
jgi:hypothetical protein